MPDEGERLNSILIISGQEAFTAAVRKTLAGRRLSSVDVRTNAAAGRRCLLEKDYGIVLVNCPLPDEFGHELAMDAAERETTSVLAAVPEEVFESVLEHVTDRGVLVLPKPLAVNRLDRAVRYLFAEQAKVRHLLARIAGLTEKTEELRIVSRAKLLLMDKMHMTEDEAHRFIGKQAMNSGISRRKAAEGILDELE